MAPHLQRTSCSLLLLQVQSAPIDEYFSEETLKALEGRDELEAVVVSMAVAGWLS